MCCNVTKCKRPHAIQPKGERRAIDYLLVAEIVAPVLFGAVTGLVLLVFPHSIALFPLSQSIPIYPSAIPLPLRSITTENNAHHPRSRISIPSTLCRLNGKVSTVGSLIEVGRIDGRTMVYT